MRRPQKLGVIFHFILQCKCQIKWKITPNVCGLLRKAELSTCTETLHFLKWQLCDNPNVQVVHCTKDSWPLDYIQWLFTCGMRALHHLVYMRPWFPVFSIMFLASNIWLEAFSRLTIFQIHSEIFASKYIFVCFTKTILAHTNLACKSITIEVQ